MINKVLLIGNLGKDPEIRHLESGAVVARFSIATSENYRDKNSEWQTLTEWHEIVAWRYQAEYAQKKLRKGILAYIEGKLVHRKWQDQDGNNRKTTEVVAHTIRALEKNEDLQSLTNNNTSISNIPEPPNENVQNVDSNNSTIDDNPDDLPF